MSNQREMVGSPYPRLGRYEVVGEIAKGAMGVVYLAKDPLIGRLLALKTFRPGFAVDRPEAEQFRARFLREAQSAGILSHPGIVTIHDVVEDGGDGIPFIAMEYVRGTNLKELLRPGRPLPTDFVVAVAEQAAAALDYAHSLGVVHRDIKPANILITADERVKITDFGIARFGASNLTTEGQLLGTPNYMAPEQVLGREAGPRADVFSLGVVLYEMLTSHRPFEGENLTVVSHRIVYEAFPPARDHVAELPGAVEEVLARAMEKEPARRFGSAGALAAALAGGLGAEAPEVGGTPLAVDGPSPAGASPAPAALVPQPPRRAVGTRYRRTLLAAALLALAAIGWVTGHSELAPPELGLSFPRSARLDPLLGRLLAEARRRWAVGDPDGSARSLAAAAQLAPGSRMVRWLAHTVGLGGGVETSRPEPDRPGDPELAAGSGGTGEIAPGAAGSARPAGEAAAFGAGWIGAEPTAVAGAGREAGRPAAVSGALGFVIDFASAAPEGMVMIYSRRGQLWRRSFRAGRRSGGGEEDTAAEPIEAPLAMPAGVRRLWVYVALPGRKAEVEPLDLDLAAGGPQRIRIRVAVDGSLAVEATD